MRRLVPSLHPLAGVLLLAAALTGAHCRSGERAAPTPTSGPGPLGAAAVAPSAAAPAPSGLSEDEARVLLPGVDVSMLSSQQRADLVELAGDTYSPCGPKTALMALRDPAPCKAAARLIELSKRMLLAGMPKSQVLLRVETYYNGFPKHRRVDVAAEGPSKGPASARVTIVEFSDFECPACRAAHPALAEVVKKFPADVRVVFRNFPLPQHQHASRVAAAGVWAARQGKFWNLADQVFEHQDKLDDAHLRELATTAGLDAGALLEALEKDPSLAAKVQEDVQTGTKLDIHGTPTLYINGRQLTLPPSPELLAWTVEDELEWTAAGGKWASAPAAATTTP